MASFCKQCSEDMFGEDHQDLAGLGVLKKRAKLNYGFPAICEGCGFILVDEEGRCVDCDLMVGKPGHGPKKAGV